MCDAIGFGSFVALGIVADAPAEGVAFIEEQCRFGVNEGGARNGGSDFSGGTVEPAKTTGEGAAENAFLNPGFILFEFFVCSKAGEFGAGAGATGRAIESFAGALNKIPGMRAGDGWRTKEFDVIDFRKPLVIDRLTNAPAKIGKLFSVGEGQIVAVSFGKEKPVAAPGNITVHRTRAGNIYDERTFGAPTGDVGEENDSGSAGGIGGFEKSCANDDVRAARFIYNCRAESVKLVAKNAKPIGHAAAAEVGSAADDYASRFATGVRVYDRDASHETKPRFIGRTNRG